MPVSREDMIRMERCHVKAWPALETRSIEGWHWRASGGGSQRANSVSTVDFTGTDVTTALDAVESAYRALGLPARFHTFDACAPADLPDRLRARGYTGTETTLTMFKPIERRSAPPDVEQYDHATAEWQDIYLGAISENRRQINTRILAAIPEPRAFFACRREGRLISTALSVTGYGCAVVECVATREDVRRQGGAQAVLLALEAWASGQSVDLIGLQVVATNTGAITLYERLGFVAGATNHFWMRPV